MSFFFFIYIVEWTMNDAKRMYKILWPISKPETETDSDTFYMGTGKGYVGLGNRKLWEWER